MAFSTESYEMRDRAPDEASGQWMVGHLINAGTSVAVRVGAGELGSVHNNIAVAGTVDFHDAAAGASLDATNRILRVDSTTAGEKHSDRIAFRQGLQVVTSAATNDVTFNLRGRAQISTRTFPAR